LAFQAIRKGQAGVLGKIRGVFVDHDEQRILLLWERPLAACVEVTEAEGFREHVGRIGVDTEVAHRVVQKGTRYQDGRAQHP